MDFRAIGRSGALGLVIGAVLVLIGEADATLPERLLTLLLAGTAGLAIGAVTEWLTSLLPARIARTGTYFLISAGIAVTISALVTVAWSCSARSRWETADGRSPWSSSPS